MKRKGWKVVLGVIGTVVLLGGLLVADAHRRAAARLDRERVEVQAGIAAFRARDHRRPSPLKEVTDGNAWDYYGPAVQAIGAIPEELATLVSGPDDPDPDAEILIDDHAIHSLVREYRPELDRLRQGLRCGKSDLVLGVNTSDPVPLVTETIHTARFLAGIAAHEHRMGRDADGWRAAETGLALGQDYGRAGIIVTILVGLSCEVDILHALKPAFEGHSFAAAPLAEFAEVLDRLDASRPDVIDGWRLEEWASKKLLLDVAWDDIYAQVAGLPASPVRQSLGTTWRALYSRRITRAQAVVRLGDCYRQMEGIQALPSWERVAAAKKVDEGNHLTGEHSSSGNVLIDVAMPSLYRPVLRDALVRLQRTLLRLSVAVARHEAEQGSLPVRLEDLVPRYLSGIPPCPLTGLPLHYKDGRIWSVGKNRVDDGGTPGLNNDLDDDTGDVVWTVKRRQSTR